MVISTDLNSHLILTDLSGKVLDEAESILVHFKPPAGVYKFSIMPEENGEAILDAMIIGQNDKYLNAQEKIRFYKNVRQTFLLTYLGKKTDSIRIIPIK